MVDTKNIEQKDLKQYVYDKDKNVEVPGNLLLDMIMLMEKLVEEELTTRTKFKYSFLDEGGALHKHVTKEQLESGKYKKIVDVDKTITEPSFEHTISEKGVAYAQLKIFLEKLHFENVQKGVAKHYSEIAAGVSVESDKG